MMRFIRDFVLTLLVFLFLLTVVLYVLNIIEIHTNFDVGNYHKSFVKFLFDYNLFAFLLTTSVILISILVALTIWSFYNFVTGLDKIIEKKIESELKKGLELIGNYEFKIDDTFFTTEDSINRIDSAINKELTKRNKILMKYFQQ